jgi:lipoprotein-anchoring transpeptidase ErfK/SrfK
MKPGKSMRPKLLPIVVLAALAVASTALAGGLSLGDVNKAEFTKPSQKDSRAINVKAQVLLDRQSFSPGAIDGRRSDNFANALRAFQQQNGLNMSGELDAATWKKLSESSDPALIEYTISAADTKGPFAAEIPQSYEKKAELKRLDYTGPLELLAERFHMDEDLLRQLNREKSFDKPGTVITVANVSVKPVALRTKVGKLEVDKTRKWVRVLAPDGKLLAGYPASIGSEEKPAPSGTLKVVRVARGPSYTYNPDFKFRGVKADRELKIAAGPNNPVGSVWIALNEKSYGIHGSAEPAKVGKVDSHGCVRMTNWDALALARLVRKGTIVEFIE